MKNIVFKNRSLKFIVAIILLVTASINVYSQGNEKKTISIGIVLDGEWERNQEALTTLKAEIFSLLNEEYSIQIPENKILSGNWNFETMKSSLKQLLNDTQTEIIVALGETVSRAAQLEKNLSKPVIATVVINPDTAATQNPVNSIEQNLNQIFVLPSLSEQIPSFKQLYDFNKAAVLVNELFIDDAIENLTVKDVDLHFVPVSKNIEKSISRIPADAQVVIVEPLRFLSYRDFDVLTEKLYQKGLPVFTMFDEKYVQGKVLAGFVPKELITRLSRRVAINLQRILAGETPSEIPGTFPVEDELVINMQTARDLKIYPSWSVMTDSKIINDEKSLNGIVLTLEDATKLALDSNLDLLGQNKIVEAGLEEVSIAKAHLLPQIESSFTGLLVDKDKAKTSFGLQSERSLFSQLSLTQIIYDEKTWANLDVQESKQIIREYELEQARLDIILESAVGYLNLLRAKSVEKIQNENLTRTKANLHLANYRYSVGSGRLAETYRWESELANNKKSVIEANTNRNLAEMNLNKLLNKPIERNIFVNENDINQIIDIIADQNLSKYLGNKWYFKSLRDFVVEEGIKYSPEIKIIDEAITIQDRVKTSSKNSLFFPTIALKTELNNTFYKGGEGSKGMNLSIPSLNYETPEQDDTYWTAALNISFNLFDGGAKFNEVEKSEIELNRLKIEKQSVIQLIEQNIRASLHQTGSSFAGISEANKSAEAANKNLELVIDAYSRGAVSIVDLIDAQNSALVSSQLAVDAVYNFLIDLLKVERAMGRFYYSISEEERRSFNDRLENYIQKNLKF